MQNVHQMFTVTAHMTFDQFWTIPSLKSVSVYLYFWVVLLAQYSLGYVTAYKLASGQDSSFGHVYWITQPLLSLKSELLSWHSLVKCLDSLLNHCTINDSHILGPPWETSIFFLWQQWFPMCCPFLHTVHVQCFSDSGHREKIFALPLSQREQICQCVPLFNCATHTYNLISLIDSNWHLEKF